MKTDPESVPATQPVALVTGAAGTLGQAVVTAFVKSGWRVAAGWHRRQPMLSHLAILPIQMDVRQSGDVAREICGILKTWDRLDVVVHAAGISCSDLLLRSQVEDWDSQHSVHLDGARNLARAVWPFWSSSKFGGHLILVGSHAGRGAAGLSGYAASKAAVVGFGQSLAREGGTSNIRCNVVLPGWMESNMTSSLDPHQKAELAAANLLNRWNNPDEPAAFIVHLAGMQNVSGQVFALDSRIQPWLG